MEHTKGNWEISKHATPKHSPQYGIHNGGRNDFCIVKGENAEVDAKLISAAPELLIACKSLASTPTDNADHFLRALKDAERAIEKAEL